MITTQSQGKHIEHVIEISNKLQDLNGEEMKQRQIGILLFMVAGVMIIIITVVAMT